MSITSQDKGKAAIIKYVKDALNPANGAAYWADPDGTNGPEGALLSQFIVKTLAEHVKAMEGCILEEQHFPVGAFILSITAVMRAFRMFTTGAFINAGPFSKDNIGALTTEWQESPSVKTFLAKPHRQDKLLRKVNKHLSGGSDTEGVNNDAGNNQHSGLGKGAHIIMDHSSPLRYDDDA
ncbi:hypothetical protein EWM64_g10993 [Hericium alpestre]|uniref:Uncharacterized protein n=1 Tax=Hericium alpestre TaxID=135208 RepID=A0A4Y9ZHQ3_9AGAM|nr:hypothetical protein EWM64_g10993 [Hericium alpestre]